MRCTGALIALAVVLACARPAAAEELCVIPADGCTQANTYQLFESALAAAAADADGDSIQLGAATYFGGSTGFAYANASAPVDISGQGESTVLTAGEDATRVLDLGSVPAGSSVMDLRIEIDGDAPALATGLRTAAYTNDVTVVEAAPATASRRGVTLLAGADLENAAITLSDDGAQSTTGVVVASFGSVVRETRVRAVHGLRADSSSTALDRVRVDARRTGIAFLDGGLVRNSLVTVSGSDDTVGITAVNTDEVYLAHTTVAGPGSGSAVGIAVRTGADEPAAITTTGVVVHDFPTTLERTAMGTGTADLAVTHSDVDLDAAVSTGPGTFTAPSTSYHPDRRFADEDTGDFRLRGDSPLIDAGDATLFPTDELDLGGLPRFGYGTTFSALDIDIGAHEYQRAAPEVGVPSSAAAVAGVPFSLKASVSDANEGEAATATFVWRLDEAKDSESATFARTFTAPGKHVLTVSATDLSGATTTEEVALEVLPAPPPAAVAEPAAAQPAATPEPPVAGPPAPPRADGQGVVAPRAPRLSRLVVRRGRALVFVDTPARVVVRVQRRRGKRWRTVRTRRVTAARAGRVGVRLGRLPRGRHRVAAVATSSAGVRSAELRKALVVR